MDLFLSPTNLYFYVIQNKRKLFRYTYTMLSLKQTINYLAIVFH